MILISYPYNMHIMTKNSELQFVISEYLAEESLTQIYKLKTVEYPTY